MDMDATTAGSSGAVPAAVVPVAPGLADFPPGRAEFVAAAAPPVAPWNVKAWMSALDVESEDAVKAALTLGLVAHQHCTEPA